MMKTEAPTVLEVCCASADFAVAAAAAGADRVELCANLVEGGTTPSVGAIEATVARLAIPVMVMIRPRGGDFLYSDLEMDVMLRDIGSAREAGADGVVFGVLDADGCVSRTRVERLVEAARPMAVTFHRAFDLSRDLDESLDVLLRMGVDRVLTSAGRPSVVDDLVALERLARTAAGRLTILPGGGIRPSNVHAVLAVPGIREVHIGASRWAPSPMRHRVDGVAMGRAYEPDEYVLEEADLARIHDVARGMRAYE
jgi:copper homeostasis protein